MGLDNPQALANRLIDALGAEESLRGPVRDLANQPLTLRVLQLQGGPQRSAIQALSSHLAGIYSPRGAERAARSAGGRFRGGSLPARR